MVRNLTINNNLTRFRLVIYLTICCGVCLPHTTVAEDSAEEPLNQKIEEAVIEETVIVDQSVKSNQPTASNKSINPNQLIDETELDEKTILQDVLLNEDYAEEKETKEWQRIQPKKTSSKVTKEKEKSEFEKWLDELWKKLFGDDEDKDSDSKSSRATTIDFFALFLKTVLVLALLGLIAWMIRNADKLQLWFQQSSLFSRAGTQVTRYQQAHLAQGWENLPAHADVPSVVKQLLDDQQILPASSILYRASLRWLNQHQYLAIKPANTEMQCIHLVTHVQNAQSEKILSRDSGDYIIDIIHAWIPIAYGNVHGNVSRKSDMNKPKNDQTKNNTSNVNGDMHARVAQLQQQTQLWLRCLPNDKSSRKDTSNMDGSDNVDKNAPTTTSTSTTGGLE